MTIFIWLTEDGRSYVIDSATPLYVGGTVCEHPPGMPNELVCQAPPIAGFRVNAEGGGDVVTVAKSVAIPVTLSGAGGNDRLVGGSGPDKLIGGTGRDGLAGRAGNDLIFGGAGNDALHGGSGDDILRGGPGRDAIGGGSGTDNVRQD
jgi:hypothetical protein